MSGPFVHDIDPIIFSAWGMHAWWYGLSYSLGFLNAHFVLRRNRQRLGLTPAMVYEMTLLLAGGVLAGGRALVVFNEWGFYRTHLSLIPAVWLGGLATHGLIAGGAIGILVFCLVRRQPFRPLFDALAIPVAVILACGRAGNFIDGQIVGGITEMPWGVQFPEADGVRHPVVLYDGLKNLALVPVLLWVRRRGVPPGRVAALFLLLYAGLRIPIDLLREYPLTLAGLPSGQTVNVLMAVAGGLLLLKNWLLPPAQRQTAGPSSAARLPTAAARRPSACQRLACALLLLVPLVIPSDATRDVPATYGRRHPGLDYSRIYPRIESSCRREPAQGGRTAPQRPSRLSFGTRPGRSFPQRLQPFLRGRVSRLGGYRLSHASCRVLRWSDGAMAQCLSIIRPRERSATSAGAAGPPAACPSTRARPGSS